MKKNIVIISKVIVGPRANPIGFNGLYLPFMKSLGERLAKALNNKFNELNMDYVASTDTTYEFAEDIIKNGATKVLISPYIKSYIDYKKLDKESYYILSYDEFNNINIDKFLETL